MSSRSAASSTIVGSSSSGSRQRESSRSERSKSGTSPAVESAVTRLLVSIKKLLEALTEWSNLKVDENHVSDVYVQLGNNFNAAVAAFGAFNIDMSELMSVPDDLRQVLEQCLSEDATVENLEIYLPTVRSIITNLLQGLRGKQSIYRRLVSDHKHRPDSGHQRTDSSRLSRSSRRDTRGQQSRSGGGGDDERDGTQRRSINSRRRENGSSNADEPFIGGFSPHFASQPGQDLSELPAEPSMPNPYERKHASTPSSIDPNTAQPHSPPPPTSTSLDGFAATPAVPASVKRYSLVDKPGVPPSVVVEPSSPDPAQGQQQNEMSSPPETPSSEVAPSDVQLETPPMDASQAPAMANSLAALKRSETLERRASKRFSTYNISKITSGASRDRSQRQNNNRRSMAVGSVLTPGELAVLTEVDDEEPSPKHKRRDDSRSRSRPETPDDRLPPVPPLPSTPARTPEPPSVSPEPKFSVMEPESKPRLLPDPQQSIDGKITVFLQLGREVKKVSIDPGLSMSSLRILFVDKFSYNPGLEKFPTIYIRDPSSGVQYELEDVDEVKEKCLLSLNIEPLDQIKQHIDSQISSLSKDLKELKSAVANNQRQSMHLSPIITSPLTESTPAPNRPTDRQFQNVARRLSKLVGNNANTPSASSPTTAPPTGLQQAQLTGVGLQPQMTGGSVLSDYSTRVVSDLKIQFDEVQNLRRDLGIMRQLYSEFMKQTKESLNTLRGQTQSVKQLANSQVGGARAFIDSGKQKLDLRTQNALTDVEKLQDTVESLKDDVLKRHVSPKAMYLKSIKKDMDSVNTELESLKEHVNTILPMWKKTWAEELANIVDEQHFMTHQEEFLADLIEDYKAVAEVFGHVEQVINLRGTGSGKRVNGRGFRPPPPEEGHGGLSTVMLEIKGANVDPEKRLKAIEANQRNRQKELASRSDELQQELTDFVSHKKLRMTGGAEEAERVRQKRNDMTLKAMFTGGPGGVDETGGLA
ncbi:AIP3-domain-containing protein [Marasmius fiardii PR-910]|nr:AIP3-domain-containing protein [Marasmius fiardii PR-910]